MAKFLVINGPNLNLLGSRETATYGSDSLDSINARLLQQAQTLGHDILFYQSNAEHELINKIQQSQSEIDIMIINPAAFTHTSIALRDTLLATQIPFIEVHLSNIHAREPFRHNSYFSDIAIGIISGFGSKVYDYALDAANQYIQHQELIYGHSQS